LRHALSINPKYIFVALVLASLLFSSKRYQEVIDAYAGIDVDTLGLPEVYSHLATSCLELGKTEEALSMAQKATSLPDALPSSYVCLAISNWRLGRMKEALSCASEYIRLFPEGPEIEEVKKLRDLLQGG